MRYRRSSTKPERRESGPPMKGAQTRRNFAPRILLLTVLAGVGLSAVSLAGDNPKADVPDEPPIMELLVSPAAEPVPALKYRLLPKLAEQTPGNGALDYRQALNRDMPRFDQNRLNSWLELPPDRLPAKELEAALAAFARTLTDVEQASHREVCDWQLPVRRHGFDTRLNDFQNLRIPARVLSLKARLQIARGDLDGAMSSMATIFKLSRDSDQGRLLIPSLIACGIAGMNSDTLQAFVQHPKAPNLYWALTDLPSPLVDCRDAVNLEALSLEYTFPQLAVFRSRRLTAEEARRQSDELLARWFRVIKDYGAGTSFKTLDEARLKFASAAKAANDKQVLLDSGWSKADVVAMPPEQVAWLILDYRWRIGRDELLKWAGVTPPQRNAGARRAQERLKESLSTEESPLADFDLTGFLPVTYTYAAVDRRDRMIALFRVIEALRIYAAAHHGALPASLQQIGEVPIPVDPATGQPFRFKPDENGAASLETPRLDRDNRLYGRHYVIRVRK
jgi:hypothetical protein